MLRIAYEKMRITTIVILLIIAVLQAYSQRGFLDAYGCNKFILEWGAPGMGSTYELLDTCKNEILIKTYGTPRRYKLVYEEYRNNKWIKRNDWLRLMKDIDSGALILFVCTRTFVNGKPKYEVLCTSLYMIADIPELRTSTKKEPVIEMNMPDF